MQERGSEYLQIVRPAEEDANIACRTYTGPRTTDTIDMLPPEDPEDILSDYDMP